MAKKNLFVEDQHGASRRFAVLEDDGTSAWLYLTEPDSRKPAADAWVYNRIAAPPTKDIPSYRGGPPPAAQGFASASALCRSPEKHGWSFLWSPGGESVALLKDGEAVACIISGKQGGFSRELIKDGPWGHTWSDEVFHATFETEE